MTVIKQIYKLRRDFVLIGLTGRTGSGCTSVSRILEKENFTDLKTEYKEINDGPWDNDSRKNKIIYNYMKEHWHPFRTIKASDVIFYYGLKLSYSDFVKEFSLPSDIHNEKVDLDATPNEDITKALADFKDKYEEINKNVLDCEKVLDDDFVNPNSIDVEKFINLLFNDVHNFREEVTSALHHTTRRIIAIVLQRWGDNIRAYDTVIIPTDVNAKSEKAPACLARKINRFIKLIRLYDKKKQETEPDVYTHIVIDALRNPYEVLYFRERYSAFYLMSINTDKQTRINQLVEKGFNIEEIRKLDEREEGQSDVKKSYMAINILKCIELSDIHIAHYGEPRETNRLLNNQIATYLSLIRHPGLIPPSPIERVMQIAYTAKLNSGCLSRQVGAAVTNEDYSIQAIGWNTVAQGQTPCSLRSLSDLCNKEDETAFSDYEQSSEFTQHSNKLYRAYKNQKCIIESMGLPLSYCFKDIYTSANSKQTHNQVHTRALHAEENAFLQLAKYGSHSVEDGKLFTTSSCCELCGKKAYQLGIKEIYYIDDYPGITHKHIIGCGTNRPKMILFHGAIGRAYINLFNPFLPLKDEIEGLTDINVKDVCDQANNVEDKKTYKNDND